MVRKVSSLVLLVLLLQAAFTPFVSASEVTRAEYVERDEPICKQNTLANRHILKGLGKDLREKDFHAAGGKFTRAALALGKTVKRLEGVPQPKADEARLSRWFAHLNDEVDLLKALGEKLRRGNRAGLGPALLKLRHNASVTNNIVLRFGFEYCLLQTARYL